ncbi:MAG: class I SAM-dependent methyltransferase [Pseudomonadales bacterium]|nr:class I SAM-dependent methyltransferase [Pseudomonadales bacterium]
MLLSFTACIQAQEQDAGYIMAPERSQGGIGKFYQGREISGVMGHQAAEWLERPQRTHEEMPDEVVANMGLEPDDVVADIGAGSGYFSFRIAHLVPQGKVLAVDIQPEMLALIETRKQQENITNIEGVLGQIDDPRLPENAVDVVLMVDAYHEFSHPYEMMSGIVKALKPGGKVILLEYRGEDRSVPIRPLHKMTEQQVVKEMGVFDLYWEDTLDFLPWQHMLVFVKQVAVN